MNQPSVYLLSCGDELLFGQTVDTNSAWLAEQCTRLGWRVLGHRTIGDVTPDLVGAFIDAAGKADMVIVTGGLGPTADDRTRQALAHAMGCELVEDPVALEEIEKTFRDISRPMNEANRVQALIPIGAKRVKNPVGSAPGIHATLLDAQVFCLPGVPREMRRMFTDTIEPIMNANEQRLEKVMRQFHSCGMGESDIGVAIRHLMGEKSNPEVGTNVHDTIVTIRVYATGETREKAEKVADRAEQDIRSALGEDIFGVENETLPGKVVELLKQHKACLITAESCTGGMISSLIVDIPGASDVFREGVVAYSNEAKMHRLGVSEDIITKHGAVSKETAAAMAETPLRIGEYPRPAYCLSVTGIAGPDGGTPEKPVGTVWIACAKIDRNGDGMTRTMYYKTLSNRQGIRARATNAALDLLRRTILGYPSKFKAEDRHWKKG